MTPDRFKAITENYLNLRIGLVGDFCLDRYLEIDPAKEDVSIETGRTVHNVVNVRPQPGGAGTILSNLAALGIGTIYPVGFAGIDGEGFELRRVLELKPGVNLQHFIQTSARRTFTYCKPLLIHRDKAPEELERLDSKNWDATPDEIQKQLAAHVEQLARSADALILLSQVDVPETGVITQTLLRTIGEIAKHSPDLLILADSRMGLQGYPPVCLKMNRAEFCRLSGSKSDLALSDIQTAAVKLAREKGRSVFITLAEAGLVGANADGGAAHVAAMPIHGAIDIVGAGDAVSANLVAGLAAGAELEEALTIANAAASVVIHQLGTTGSASVAQIRERLGLESD